MESTASADRCRNIRHLTRTSRAAREIAPDDAAVRRGERDAVASGLHADEHAVKPHGTRRNRTSSAASGARAGRVRSSRDGNREFFQNPPPPDGPRRPRAAAGPLPAAGAHAPGNGTIAGDDAPCPSRWPDTAGPPAAATRAVPPRAGLATVPRERMRGRKPLLAPLQETNPRTAMGRDLPSRRRAIMLNDGPRESLLPKVKSRQWSFYSAPGRLWTRHLLLASLGPA